MKVQSASHTEILTLPEALAFLAEGPIDSNKAGDNIARQLLSGLRGKDLPRIIENLIKVEKLGHRSVAVTLINGIVERQLVNGEHSHSADQRRRALDVYSRSLREVRALGLIDEDEFEDKIHDMELALLKQRPERHLPPS